MDYYWSFVEGDQLFFVRYHHWISDHSDFLLASDGWNWSVDDWSKIHRMVCLVEMDSVECQAGVSGSI